jgi:hypothetical protein
VPGQPNTSVAWTLLQAAAKRALNVIEDPRIDGRVQTMTADVDSLSRDREARRRAPDMLGSLNDRHRARGRRRPVGGPDAGGTRAENDEVGARQDAGT